MNSNLDKIVKSEICSCCNFKKKKNSMLKKTLSCIQKSNRIDNLNKLNMFLDQEIDELQKEINILLDENKICECN